MGLAYHARVEPWAWVLCSVGCNSARRVFGILKRPFCTRANDICNCPQSLCNRRPTYWNGYIVYARESSGLVLFILFMYTPNNSWRSQVSGFHRLLFLKRAWANPMQSKHWANYNYIHERNIFRGNFIWLEKEIFNGFWTNELLSKHHMINNKKELS